MKNELLRLIVQSGYRDVPPSILSTLGCSSFSRQIVSSPAYLTCSSSMAFQRIVMSALLLTSAFTASANPHIHNLRAQLPSPNQPPPSPSLLVIPPQTTNNNSTRVHVNPLPPPPPPASIGVIECFGPHPRRPQTSVDGCRHTLNAIRAFPDYRKVQDFLTGWWPRLPSRPPYAVHDDRSNCVIQIDTGDPRVADDFSFEQVRALATEILEVCTDRGGRGGFAPIGHGTGWRVAVLGFVTPRDPAGESA